MLCFVHVVFGVCCSVLLFDVVPCFSLFFVVLNVFVFVFMCFCLCCVCPFGHSVLILAMLSLYV